MADRDERLEQIKKMLRMINRLLKDIYSEIKALQAEDNQK